MENSTSENAMNSRKNIQYYKPVNDIPTLEDAIVQRPMQVQHCVHNIQHAHYISVPSEIVTLSTTI